MIQTVHLEEESRRPAIDLPFRIAHRPGYYYVQVRATLFRKQGGSVLAQVEPFFFRRRPLRIAAEPEGHVTLPVSWPAIPPEELHHYGTIGPKTGPAGE